MLTIKLQNICKKYSNGVEAVKDFNLEIKEREFVVLVGPSGCGKSTTLRMVAGLEEITQGDLYIKDERVNDISPKDRDIAMVFQNYALYPHMNSYDNMAFGLKLRKYNKKEINDRVLYAANILDINDLLHRKPKELSGGQRQRVALGRAIVREPKVFLMDEPLSNLDAKLRVQMRIELSKLHKKLKTTFLYVTHDQVEAMTMADRIVVMKDGFIQQVGTPNEVYSTPANVFVGGFIGSPTMNFLEGSLKDNNFVFGNQQLRIHDKHCKNIKAYKNKKIILGIRPENISLVTESETEKLYESVEGIVEVIEFLGSQFHLHINVNHIPLIVSVDTLGKARLGESIKIRLKCDKTHFFDVNTQERI